MNEKKKKKYDTDLQRVKDRSEKKADWKEGLESSVQKRHNWVEKYLEWRRKNG